MLMLLDETFIQKRISELRLQLGVSERKMGLDSGHSASYIHGITSGNALPSITEFLYICDYLGISPRDFFDTKDNLTLNQANAQTTITKLTEEDLSTVQHIMARLLKE